MFFMHFRFYFILLVLKTDFDRFPEKTHNVKVHDYRFALPARTAFYSRFCLGRNNIAWKFHELAPRSAAIQLCDSHPGNAAGRVRLSHGGGIYQDGKVANHEKMHGDCDGRKSNLREWLRKRGPE